MPLFLIFLILFVNLPCHAKEAYAGKFEGPARVADGDSVWIGHEEMRLLCIDAVELHQDCEKADGAPFPCGREAKQAMIELIGGREVACYGHERDKYNRPLVFCRAGETDLNKGIVEKGWAIATCPEMRPLAATAKLKRIGIWQGKFQTPRLWRKANPWTPGNERQALKRPETEQK